MADISKIVTADNVEYTLKDATARGKLGNTRVWYGSSSTAAKTQIKVVTITGVTSYTTGDIYIITFTNATTYNGAQKINVNQLGAVTLQRVSGTSTARYEWVAGETLAMIYDGTNFVLLDGGVATTTYRGVVSLNSSSTSTSTTVAGTPSALNNVAQYIVTGFSPYSDSATYAVGDRVRYSTKAWRCTTAISTAEAWNEDHWTEIDPLQTQIDAIERLPSVSSTDNGKVLRVVSGAWAAASLPSASGVSF